MKKRYFIFILFVFCGVSIFGNNNKQEEVDYLLFLPNSGNRFVNEEQAFIQLNNLAHYLSGKDLSPGQIIVYGYAAFAQNDIGSVDLSKERAFFVMNELQKRGVSADLFSDPVGYGSVYLWGNNANEDDRKFNRRVRILLDGESPIAITPEVIKPQAETVNPDLVYKEPIVTKDTAKKPAFKFPWWLLFALAALLLLFLILFLFGRRSGKTARKSGTASARSQTSKTDATPALPAAMTTNTVNLDEEIRLRAYELSQQRDERGDYQEQDWHNAVRDISSWYESCGHSVFSDGGYWWASRSYSY
jgi:hypothetical protein